MYLGFIILTYVPTFIYFTIYFSETVVIYILIKDLVLTKLHNKNIFSFGDNCYKYTYKYLYVRKYLLHYVLMGN